MRNMTHRFFLIFILESVVEKFAFDIVETKNPSDASYIKTTCDYDKEKYHFILYS